MLKTTSDRPTTSATCAADRGVREASAAARWRAHHVVAPHRCGPHGAEVRVVGDSSLTPSAAERPRRLPLPRGSRRIAEVLTHSLSWREFRDHQ